MITPVILQEFKDRMHLEGDYEDANLKRILTASEKELRRMCGDYDIHTDEVFKELVFERSRYVYNDALEYFNKNFLWEINNLGMSKALEEMEGEPDATIQIQAQSQLGGFEEPGGDLGEYQSGERTGGDIAQIHEGEVIMGVDYSADGITSTTASRNDSNERNA